MPVGASAAALDPAQGGVLRIPLGSNSLVATRVSPSPGAAHGQVRRAGKQNRETGRSAVFLLWRQRDSAHPNRRVSHVFAVRWSGNGPGDQRFVFCRQMKNAVVATTANRGVAVSRSRTREVQSVYIAAKAQAAPILSGALFVLNCCLALAPVQAGVVFDDCQPPLDGG